MCMRRIFINIQVDPSPYMLLSLFIDFNSKAPRSSLDHLSAFQIDIVILLCI